jgi:hypothetical protein
MVLEKDIFMENMEQETDISLEHSTIAEKEIQDRLNYFYQNQDEITERLLELDEEWDIDTILQLKSSLLTLVGVTLGTTVNKKWLLLPVAAALVLGSGFAKLITRRLPILQKLGFRTRVEIEKEKYALKAIRGDFKYLLDVPNSAWNAVIK